MTNTARFQEDDRVERWCMNLPDKEMSKPRAISYSKSNRPDRKPTSSPASRVSASSASLHSRTKSEDALRRTSSAKPQSQSQSRPRSASGSSLPSGPPTSQSASVSSSQPTSRRSSSSGSMSIASSLLQDDYDLSAQHPKWYRKLRPVLPGEAHAEDGTFTIDGKTDHWQGLRRKEQARIDREDDRDLEKNLEKYVWAWKDTQSRLYAITQIRAEIEETDCSDTSPSVKGKLVKRHIFAVRTASYALNRAVFSQTGNGDELAISGFYTDFLPSYWRAVAAHERLEGMWAGLQGESTPKAARTVPQLSSKKRTRRHAHGRPL